MASTSSTTSSSRTGKGEWGRRAHLSEVPRESRRRRAGGEDRRCARAVGAIVPAGLACGGAGLQDRTGEVGVVTGVPGQHPARAVADVSTVRVARDAHGQLGDHVFAQAGICAGGTGLGTLEAGFDALLKILAVHGAENRSGRSPASDRHSHGCSLRVDGSARSPAARRKAAAHSAGAARWRSTRNGLPPVVRAARPAGGTWFIPFGTRGRGQAQSSPSAAEGSVARPPTTGAAAGGPQHQAPPPRRSLGRALDAEPPFVPRGGPRRRPCHGGVLRR